MSWRKCADKIAWRASYYMKGQNKMVTEELVRNAQLGDFEAMEELLEETEDFVFSFARTHIESEADADDVAMLVLGAIWQLLPKSAPIRKYDDWVSKIVWQKINYYFREQRRNKEIPMSAIFREEIRYSPEARREMEGVERAFRGD